MLSCSSRSGFSVVELMVSVGIVGILATVAVPTYGYYKRKAVLSEVTTNLAALKKGQFAYYYAEHAARGSGDGVYSNCVTTTTHGVHSEDPDFPPESQGAHMAQTGMRPNWPADDQAHHYDWEADPQFVALGFSPSNDVYGHYFVHGGHSAWGTPIAGQPQECGMVNSGDERVFQIGVWWNLHRDPVQGSSWQDIFSSQHLGHESLTYGARAGELYLMKRTRIEER